MAVVGVRRVPSKSVSNWPSNAEAIQLENVVRRAHERPFALHLLESPQQELSKAARALDLSDHRFDDPFARRVGGLARLREQLPGHPIDDRGILRERSTRTRPRPFAMFLLPCRDVRVDAGVG